MSVNVTLIFNSEKERDYVIAQMFVGWGENLVDIRCINGEYEIYHVVPIDEVWEKEKDL